MRDRRHELLREQRKLKRFVKLIESDEVIEGTTSYTDVNGLKRFIRLTESDEMLEVAPLIDEDGASASLLDWYKKELEKVDRELEGTR